MLESLRGIAMKQDLMSSLKKTLQTTELPWAVDFKFHGWFAMMK